MDPSWHHNYASLGWTGADPGRHEAHYPAIKPELVELTAALHGLAHEPDKRARFIADAAGYAKSYKLSPAQEQALCALDLEKMVAMGAHPLVPFLARMQIERMRRG
jgi:2,3-dihydroxyphenylpropionate 1,2-dioxygenase